MYTKEDLDNVIDFIVYQKLNACESESSRNYLQLFLDNCKVENDDAFTEKVFKLAIKYPNLVELSKDLHCDVMRLQKIIFYQQIDDKTITGVAKLKQAEHMHKGPAEIFLRSQANLFLTGRAFSIKEYLLAVEKHLGTELPKPDYLDKNFVYDFEWKDC